MTALLQLYRAGTRLLGPAVAPYLRRRLRQGKEDGARLDERRGVTLLPRPAGALIWLHGASVGESLALLPLIETLRRRGAAVLVTTGTVSSARILAERLPAGAIHQFVPLDLPAGMRRFLRHWRPDLAILAESELWPNLMIETRRQGVPLVLVNARMSQRSFERWRRLPSAIAPLLRLLDLCLAQSAEDAVRLLALGVPHVDVAGNLKFDADAPPAPDAALGRLAAALGDRPLWLAASTHADEEAAVLDAHGRVAAGRPELLTIVVPRRDDRGSAIVAAAAARGLRAQQRSQDERLRPDTAIYVADTMGELGLFYRLCRIVFVGKSLGGGGGQNPIEPAKLGCAILHGPAVANFAEVYDRLAHGGGAALVADSTALASELERLLADRPARDAMAGAAAAVVRAGQGATQRIMTAVEPLLRSAGLAPAPP